MKLRKYAPEDSKIICSWIKDQKTLYQWSADRLCKFPVAGDDLNEHYAPSIDSEFFIPLTAVDESGNAAGHLFIRYPDENDKSMVRFGFVVVSPELRGKGYGKKMLVLAIEYAKEKLGAKKITLGVFENNPNAKHCYESAGFKAFSTRKVRILDEDWECTDMELNLF